MNNKYIIYDLSLLKCLNLDNQFNISQNHTSLLREYSTFKSLTITDLNNLRLMLFCNKDIDSIWFENILRFLEIRNNEIKNRLKLNYEDSNERLFFQDYLISFLLETYYYKSDLRFLNTALKLMTVLTQIRTKQNLYNSNLTNYLINRI